MRSISDSFLFMIERPCEERRGAHANRTSTLAAPSFVSVVLGDDYLLQGGRSVFHLMGPARVEPATLTKAAVAEDDALVYPAV